MDSDVGKLFVGGISWETNEETLKDHFSKYGEVADTKIMRDRSNGHARGFGFVTFSDPSSADEALQTKHVVLGRTIEVKKAVPRNQQHQNQNYQPHQQNNRGRNSGGSIDNSQIRTKKIFVGGLSASVTEEEFKAYFEQFGRTTDVVVMYDVVTHRPRGFGFITFESEEAVENVMQKNFHQLNDKSVEVKRAVPKDGNHNGNDYSHRNSGYNTRMGGAGRGGSLFGGYPGVNYPPYGPRFGYYPPPVSSYPYGMNPYGGYPIRVYGGVGFGSPMAYLRSPWNGMGMVGPRSGLGSYGNGVFPPAYSNNGFDSAMGKAPGDQNGVLGPVAVGKWNQQGNNVDAGIDAGKANEDSSGPVGSNDVSIKQNQRGADLSHVALLSGGDVLALLVFSAIGRFSHGFPVLDVETLHTADPFIAGWFLSAYFLGGYANDGRGMNGLNKAVVAAAKSWAVGIPLGIAIRAASSGHIPAAAFMFVTMGSTAVLLIGWRALLFTILPNNKSKKNDVYRRGNPFELFELLTSLVRRW